MGYKALVAPSATRPKSQIRQYGRAAQINNLFKQSFQASTILLIGGVLQGLLLLAIPRYWILLPSLITLFIRSADTIAITLKFRPNPYLEDAIFQKWTTIIPDEDGKSSDRPADEKVAVLLLCLKLNHPLGFFAPNLKKIGEFSQAMTRELDEQAPDNGFLGQSSWNSTDSRGAVETMLLSYWRSIDDIHNYAAGPLHMKTRRHWDAMVHEDAESMRHIGISHEIFEAPRSRWEAVSLNFQPTRLGATSFFRKGDKLVGGTVEDQWVSPIVEAKGRLRNSKGRLDRVDNGSRSGSSSGDEKY